MYILKERSTHSGQLERWLGKDAVNQMSLGMKDWYGPNIAVAGVPGKVFAVKGGDFRGKIQAGEFASARDIAERVGLELAKRMGRGWKHFVFNNPRRLNTGFSSLSDLIAEATAGKRREFLFNKAGATGVVNVTNSLWGLGPTPAAGANGSAAPGGRALDDTTLGGFPFTNPSNPDTQHFVSGFPICGVAGNTLLLHDRIFDVAKTMNSSATESVTGVPTRYQGSVGAVDSPEGNFLFVEVGGTALAATAHNWTTCLYRDEAGNDNQTLPSLVGNASAIVRRLDHPVGQWFAPLANGDSGIKDLAQLQCSAAVATGEINFVIGHPIAWMPLPIANMVCIADGINTAFNLIRIFDDACLSFLEVLKPATGATTYTGSFTTVAG
jgi:hypothetical protein